MSSLWGAPVVYPNYLRKLTVSSDVFLWIYAFVSNAKVVLINRSGISEQIDTIPRAKGLNTSKNAAMRYGFIVCLRQDDSGECCLQFPVSSTTIQV